VRGSELIPQKHNQNQTRISFDSCFFSHHVGKMFIMEILLYTGNTDKRRAIEFGSQFTYKGNRTKKIIFKYILNLK